MTDGLFTLHRGDAPLLVNIPHAGTRVPPDIARRLSPPGLALIDTDWHVPRLYDFLPPDVTVLRAEYSRYVVDLNRPPDNQPLYPDRQSTGLCPLHSFRGQPLYRDGQAPCAGEQQARQAHYWEPYHAVLQEEIARLHERHPTVVLWDAHSIQSRLPRLFEGRLPDLNLGTAGGSSCGVGLQDSLEAALESQNRFTWVHNGRFKGGYITRHYGRPESGIHAVQLEIAQCAYMSEYPDFSFNEDRARRLRPVLQALIRAVWCHQFQHVFRARANSN